MMVEIGFMGTVILMGCGYFLGTYIFPGIYRVFMKKYGGEKKK